jgi:hypothetical protein
MSFDFTRQRLFLVRRGWLGGLLAGVSLCLPAIAQDEDLADEPEPFHEVIDLKPADLASFGVKNLAAPFGSLFRGPDHYYQDREIRVDTTPTGGMVDLFYVRSNFQKRFEQAETPVTVIVPARVDAGPRDSVTIRAFREGFRQKTTTVKLASAVCRTPSVGSPIAILRAARRWASSPTSP